MKQASHAVEGGEKARYLHQLDRSLEVLEKGLAAQSDESFFLQDFGDENNWDWNRLLKQGRTYQNLAHSVARIRQEYRWFDWITDQENPNENQGYFETLEISAASGMPWAFNFIELHRLRGDANQLLMQMPGYESCAKSIRNVLLTDNVDMNTVPDKITEMQKQAMKRNFLEQLGQAQLLSWQLGQYSMAPRAESIRPEGAETLWNINSIMYLPENAMFQAYTVDVWQDNLNEPHIIEESGAGKVSTKLHNAFLGFTKDSAAWYILREIDEGFDSLHPVHVSKGTVGPFENKYLSAPEIETLPLTRQLISENDNTGLFRFVRQYSYAPNHEAYKDGVRQVIYRENWSDEVIVCPARCSERVSNSVLGASVRIFEM